MRGCISRPRSFYVLDISLLRLSLHSYRTVLAFESNALNMIQKYDIRYSRENRLSHLLTYGRQLSYFVKKSRQRCTY